MTVCWLQEEENVFLFEKTDLSSNKTLTGKVIAKNVEMASTALF
jgi:hypothetical protein